MGKIVDISRTKRVAERCLHEKDETVFPRLYRADAEEGDAEI